MNVETKMQETGIRMEAFFLYVCLLI